MTRAHRSVVAGRDRAYAAFRSSYAARVHEIAADCDAALNEELMWSSNWKKMTSRIGI